MFDFENTNVTSDMEVILLYGMWGPYTITFHANSGPGTDELTPMTLETDAFGMLAQDDWPHLRDVTVGDETYSFAGWSYTDIGYTETPYQIDIPEAYADYMVFTENKALYAVWRDQLM